MAAEVKLAWHDQWQSRTRGGYEVIDVRQVEDGITAVIWENDMYEVYYYPNGGIWNQSGNPSYVDLLPVASVIP